jgi:hypothetical protein
MIIETDLEINKQLLCYRHNNSKEFGIKGNWDGRIYTVLEHKANNTLYVIYCKELHHYIIWNIDSFQGKTWVNPIKFLSFSNLSKTTRDYYALNRKLPNEDIFLLRLKGYDI